MNSLLINCVMFLCGIGIALASPDPAKKAAIVEAYYIGKQECPSDYLCMKAANLDNIYDMPVIIPDTVEWGE